MWDACTHPTNNNQYSAVLILQCSEKKSPCDVGT